LNEEEWSIEELKRVTRLDVNIIQNKVIKLHNIKSWGRERRIKERFLVVKIPELGKAQIIQNEQALTRISKN
jgi:hypothetical protein